MKDIILKAENISKQYRLGTIGTGSLVHDLNRWWHQIRGKEDPYLKIGETNDRSTKSESDYVWALQDINFEIERGEIIGIIGKNGAGKSTLLKILSRVTAPTTGSVKFGGRVASLLEVGTGFNGEMTGRENIYLNGAILGMTKKEITSKLDEIIEFSGCQRYIDTPVKRYSSGMYVRLAFAVAAFLEPEILIVDEVLAVGDAEFQKKAIGKMQDISRTGGRTVLFVSHNILAVRSLCTSGILMQNGKILKNGKIDEVIDLYLSQNDIPRTSQISIEMELNDFIVHTLKTSNNGIEGIFDIEDDLIFDILVSSLIDFEKININIFFNSNDESCIFATCSPSLQQKRGKVTYRCVVPKRTLNDIIYNIDLMVVEKGTNVLISIKNILSIEGYEKKRDGAWLEKFPGFVRPQYFEWSKIEKNE